MVDTERRFSIWCLLTSIWKLRSVSKKSIWRVLVGYMWCIGSNNNKKKTLCNLFQYNVLQSVVDNFPGGLLHISVNGSHVSLLYIFCKSHQVPPFAHISWLTNKLNIIYNTFKSTYLSSYYIKKKVLKIVLYFSRLRKCHEQGCAFGPQPAGPAGSKFFQHFWPAIRIYCLLDISILLAAQKVQKTAPSYKSNVL